VVSDVVDATGLGVGSAELSIGDRIRLHRNRAGLSQEEAAGLAGVGLSQWRKWEQNVRAVHSFAKLVDIAQALRVTDLRDLTGVPLPLTPGGEPRHEAVGPLRAALALHPVLLPAAAPVGLEALASRMRHAWTGWEAATPWRCGATGALLPDLVTDAAAAVRFGDDRPRAARLAVGVYLLVREWARLVGEHDLALLAGERGLTAAEHSDDPGCVAAAGRTMAAALSTRGQAAEALQVVEATRAVVAVDAASEHAPPELVSAWGALHLTGAIDAARLDDRAAAQEMLRRAAVAAARLGEDRNDWWLAFGPTNVAIHRVAYATELGQSRTVVRTGADLAVERAPTVERRVTHRLDVAAAHARLREDLPAVHSLLAGERESPEQVLYSPRARSVVRELLAREKPRTRPLLRPLAGRLGVLA
jgi:transcriptional regulator with XRE-family HTH domain